MKVWATKSGFIFLIIPLNLNWRSEIISSSYYANSPKRNQILNFVHINLFQLICNYLKNRKLLDRALEIQQQKGDLALLKALKGPLDAKRIAGAFIEEAKPDENDLVLVSGVGNAYPLLRSHNLLNNLHSLMGDTPLVMFYPGIYTGQGLRLFGKLKETNYYRAFQLVV